MYLGSIVKKFNFVVFFEQFFDEWIFVHQLCTV